MGLSGWLILAIFGGQDGPTAPRRLPDLEIAEVFQKVLGRWRESCATAGECGTRGPWRPGPEYLFATAYPEKTEQFARELLEDPKTSIPDLHFALNLLPWVTSRTSRELESLFVRLADHPQSSLVDAALHKLSSPHGLNRHRELLKRRSRDGFSLAIEALSYDVDPENVRFLTELQENRERDPRFDEMQVAPKCRIALERIRILGLPEWRKEIESQLRSGPDRWAEAIAARKAPELLRDHYRRLLTPDRRNLELLLRQSESFTSRFANALEIQGVSGDFDFNLFGLADFGGELSRLEKRRLYHLGLLGGAERRLLELLRVRETAR